MHSEPHDYRIYYVNTDLRHEYEFLSLSRRRSSSRDVPSGEERLFSQALLYTVYPMGVSVGPFSSGFFPVEQLIW